MNRKTIYIDKKGWILSPVFDVNPIPYGHYLSLNVSEYDSSISSELLLETAPYYGLSSQSAKLEITKIVSIIQDNWRKLARYYGLSRAEITQMEPAFTFKG